MLAIVQGSRHEEHFGIGALICCEILAGAVSALDLGDELPYVVSCPFNCSFLVLLIALLPADARMKRSPSVFSLQS